MGMFDYFFIADYSIHPNLQKVQPTDEELNNMKKAPDYGEWQTKSLDCLMDHYTLNKDGTITKLKMSYDYCGEEKENTIPQPFPYHGVIRIHYYRVLEYYKKEEVDGISEKSKKTRFIAVELVFTSGMLNDVLIVEDRIAELEKPRKFSIMRHIKEVMNADVVPLKRKDKISIYGFILDKGPYGAWAVYDNRQTISVNAIGSCIPYIPEEGPRYWFKNEYEASLALQRFVIAVQSGKHDDKDYLE